jgi:hypothetical protein
VPARHIEQSSIEDEPAVVEYRPVGHSNLHDDEPYTPLPVYRPGPHMLQREKPLPLL